MRFHIDTDMGVDDGLALFVGERVMTGISSISTVFGNVPVEVSTRNALIFRELLGKRESWMVQKGANQASDDFLVHACDVHGDDGLGGATLSLGSKFLYDIERQTVPQLGDNAPHGDGPVTLIGLGPATNINKLVSWYGRSHVQRIVLMSGAFFDIGNITTNAEFNAYCDPFALRDTLNLGIPITIVPLDVCRKVQLSRLTVKKYRDADKSPIIDLLVRAHMPYMDFYREAEGIDGCFPHDTLAVLAAFHPERFFHVNGRVTVDCTASLRGMTVVELDAASHVSIVTGGELKWVRNMLYQLGRKAPA